MPQEKKEKAVFCWSGGKDSALALYEVLQDKTYEVKYLLTTLNENFRRISMHGVREELLEKQAQAIGIPLMKMYVKEGSNDEYERNMEAFLLRAKAEGINHVIFGDIFLEDLRAYREKNMEKVGMKAVFPLWKRNTKDLIEHFLSLHFQTVTCCVNDAYLGEDKVGTAIDAAFVHSLPANVDPCGENGEFHSFCFAGPIFKEEIPFQLGEKVYKPLELKKADSVCPSEKQKQKQNESENENEEMTRPVTKGFWFCDLIPA
jgi:uncharacterized protein (TIGR00290 family)